MRHRRPEVVLKAAALCDQVGIDTNQAGATIAFAMECGERGLLDAPGLRFGDAAALLSTLETIGRREGLETDSPKALVSWQRSWGPRR